MSATQLGGQQAAGNQGVISLGGGGGGGGTGNVSQSANAAAANHVPVSAGANKTITSSVVTINPVTGDVAGVNDLVVAGTETVDTVDATSLAATTATFGGKTLSLAGNFSTSGAFTLNFAVTANTNVTLPTAGPLSALAGVENLSNKTIIQTAAHSADNLLTGTVISGLNAGATITQWQAVYLGSSSTWLLADANGSGTYPARGLAVAAYSNTNPATILVQGTVRHDAWSWTPGGTLYLSDTAGDLTQTVPSSSGDKVQQVGFALTATIAYLNFASGEYATVT